MKKIIAIVAVAVALLVSANASAQLHRGVHYGVVGGLTYAGANVKEFDASNLALYHAGITLKANLGAGFAIQPSLIYQVKGASIDKYVTGEVKIPGTLQTNVGFIELPVAISWGPQIRENFRPYFFIEPFIGYGLTNDSSIDVSGTNIENLKNVWEDTYKRIEYGTGAGLGIEFWRLQFSVQYFMNFGTLADEEGKVSGSAIKTTVSQAFKEGANFKGIKASIAILF